MGNRNSAEEAAPMLDRNGEALVGSALENQESRSWMSPLVVLLSFTALNFALYFDRGAAAGALSSIRVDTHLSGATGVLSDARSGLLVSGFTIGYLFTSPLFVSRGSVWGSRIVILLGMLLWCMACLGCAASMSYTALLLCRVLVGVSEAAFVGFTVTIIDNIAPPAHRTSWIGFFYSMIPVGTAVGMGCGGVLTSYAFVWGLPAWRLLFLAEVVAAVPIIALVALVPARYHLAPVAPDATPIPVFTATGRVLKNVTYMLLVLGFATYCFVTGAVSTWGIPLLHEGPLQLPKTTAAVFMGLATTLSGVVGSLLGGVVVDRLGGSTGRAGAIQCQKFDILMLLIAIPCGAMALLSTSMACFSLCFIAAVVALFAITAPINASILTVVPAELRPYAVSYSVFFIHLLGDFPSPTLTGIVSDYLGRHCRGLSKSVCVAHTVDLQCVWVHDATIAYCTNRVQLRDALLIVFTYLFIAPPCWALVWRRLRNEAHQAEEEALVAEVVVSAISSVSGASTKGRASAASAGPDKEGMRRTQRTRPHEA